MLTKSILKIWLLSVNFKEIRLYIFTEFTLFIYLTNHSQAFEVLCDWSSHKFIEVNFSSITDSNQIFRNDFVCNHYDLFKMSSQIIECKIFATYDFFDMNSL